MEEGTWLMGVGMRCFRCGDRDVSCQLSLMDEGHSESEGWALCARCGEVLRAWLEGLIEEVRAEMPGEERSRRRMSEVHAPSEGMILDEDQKLELLGMNPPLAESRTDRRPSPKTAADGSSSPPVACSCPAYADGSPPLSCPH